jgi:hypothetical protein
MTPLLNRMLTALSRAEAPPLTPLDFEASFVDGDCPDQNVLLTWDNGGRVESKVLQFSPTGSAPWEQIATPGTGDTSYKHVNPDVGMDNTGHWRIRWTSESEYATDSLFLIGCPE